ncbi:FeoB-associated Cys-rich membrane protein [Bacillus sp. 1P06AnD]|uniref:FeoB-associated Cys-rich membrane protein n=1 Tax=Bacillus sp. 1P06AnD TaxID=3132208 RepID=UPI0039A08E68
MSLLINIIVGLVIFGYAAFALWRSIKKQKGGKCAGCALNKSCSTKSCDSIVTSFETSRHK